MPFDYKKVEKEYYMPKEIPELVTVPSMNFMAIKGKGNPNTPDGEYKAAVRRLFSLAYGIKMSQKRDSRIEGFYDYVVPPLEGLWWQENNAEADWKKKENFCWISLIRLPEFITEPVFSHIKEEMQRKKKQDYSRVKFLTMEEGLCVQCMHKGTYDQEIRTLKAIENFIGREGYVADYSVRRFHYEIYLSLPGRTVPAKQKTVIRIPVKKEAE